MGKVVAEEKRPGEGGSAGGAFHKLFEKRVTGRSVDDFIERGGFSERRLSLVQRWPRGPAARSGGTDPKFHN